MIPSRRRFLIGAGASAAVLSLPPKKAQAVVLGAGPAGARAALSLALARQDLSVVLIERDPTRFNAKHTSDGHFERVNTSITLGALQSAGVSVLLDDATDVDWTARRMAVLSGRAIAFDRLYLAPGAQAMPEKIVGLDARTRHFWPAAWGSLREAYRLQAQIKQLRNGGHVILRLPKKISHPHVALNRAIWLAQSCTHLTVLDAGHNIHLRDMVRQSVKGKNIRWLTAGKGGGVVAVDASRGTIETDAGRLMADVVNFVPQHGAGQIAWAAGLVDETGWSPVDARSRSTQRPEVAILGDGQADAIRLSKPAMRSARHVVDV